jgi:diaminopimelate epimerase
MNLDFYKIHTGRNDFALFNLLGVKDFPLEELPPLSRSVCNRREGVGANGAIYLFGGSSKAVSFRFFRTDGEESLLCADALLCFSRYAFDSGMFHNNRLEIETIEGTRTIRALDSDNFCFDLGSPRTLEDQPIIPDPNRDFFERLTVEGQKIPVIPLQLLKPAAAVIDSGEYSRRHRRISRGLERHSRFGGRIFPVFVTIHNRDDISVDSRLGSLNADNASSCALGAAAAVLAGLTDREIMVRSRGCRYFFQWLAEDNLIRLTGSANYAFSGSFYYEEQGIK